MNRTEVLDAIRADVQLVLSTADGADPAHFDRQLPFIVGHMLAMIDSLAELMQADVSAMLVDLLSGATVTDEEIVTTFPDEG